MTETLSEWTFLTNHLHVLLVIATDTNVVLRDVALKVGITERAVQKIVKELEESGYLTRTRMGRANQYEINFKKPLRHPLEAHHSVGVLLELLQKKSSVKKTK